MNPILLELPMPIITPRLILRPPERGEGAMLNQAIIESFEALHHYMDWAKKSPVLPNQKKSYASRWQIGF